MPFPDVRRLAAVDMHGAHGTLLRRRIILAEFVLGALAGTGLGIFLAVASSSVGWVVFGALLAGICLKRGLVIYPGGGTADGVNGDHFLLCPPFTITESELDELFGLLDEALSEFEEARPVKP
jgi:adenosylmethionine-8-amino-7-oxononanoate aminotransferase